MSIISKFKIIGTIAGKVATSKTAKIVVPVVSVGCTLLSGIQQKNDVIEGMLTDERFNKRLAEEVNKALNSKEH